MSATWKAKMGLQMSHTLEHAIWRYEFNADLERPLITSSSLIFLKQTILIELTYGAVLQCKTYRGIRRLLRRSRALTPTVLI